MKPKHQAAGLIALLFVFALALGIEFGSSGLSGGSPGSGHMTVIANKGKIASPPEFVLKAVGINPVDLYESASSRTVLLSVLIPLAGLRATLTPLKSLVASHGRTPYLTLTTNSSGIAEIVDFPGNYSFLISNSYYQLDAIVSLTLNTTTTLTFTLQGSVEPVISLRIVSPDSILGVEPMTGLYALVDNATGPAPGFAELVGFGHTSYLSSGSAVVVNTTVVGGYPGTQGFWAALSPTGSFPAYPSQGILLFQYRPLYEVSSTAG